MWVGVLFKGVFIMLMLIFVSVLLIFWVDVGIDVLKLISVEFCFIFLVRLFFLKIIFFIIVDVVKYNMMILVCFVSFFGVFVVFVFFFI